ncbi:MAG: DEAD/DEAH box helicase family protein, partial [Haloferacaceae archaeon]
MTDAQAGDPAVTLDAFLDALGEEGRPVATAQQIARRCGCTQAEAAEALSALADAGDVGRLDVDPDPVVWYPEEWSRLADRERVVVFPDRREVVVDHPTQFTRARLATFAHLTDTTEDRAYRYEIRREDVWNAPVDDLGDLLTTMRDVLPRRCPGLEDWVEEQWKRARLFRLYTHEDGYTVLEADTAELMGNVARQHLDEDELHGPISDTESWVREGEAAAVKRTLYEAGYPVRDDRDLDRGAPLDVDLTTELRDYQRDWVDRFVERGAGVLVGPPGSGKTVAAIGAVAAVGGETLVLVPSRELAGQ